MSADNTIAPSGRERETPEADVGTVVRIPEDVAARYQVRAIEPAQGSHARIGLFAPGDATNPAIEISGERIVARKEDPETVATLVKLAEHNRWDKIDVEGSAEFRKAVWAAGTRAGLTVNGYEPNFAELEQVEVQRREDTLRRERETARQSTAEQREHTSENVERTVEVAEAAMDAARAGPPDDRPRADAEPRLPKRTSATTLAQASNPVEDRAVMEHMLTSTIRALEASGDPRAAAMRETASALVDQIYGERGERTVSGPAPSGKRRPQVEPEALAARAEQERRADRPRDRGEQLAELFLNGTAEAQAAEPRLINALRAQATMELNIGELYKDNPSQIAAANLESRALISDVLRRGLDVSVREPTPVRQIEPAHSPEMER